MTTAVLRFFFPPVSHHVRSTLALFFGCVFCVNVEESTGWTVDGRRWRRRRSRPLMRSCHHAFSPSRSCVCSLLFCFVCTSLVEGGRWIRLFTGIGEENNKMQNVKKNENSQKTLMSSVSGHVVSRNARGTPVKFISILCHSFRSPFQWIHQSGNHLAPPTVVTVFIREASTF